MIVNVSVVSVLHKQTAHRLIIRVSQQSCLTNKTHHKNNDLKDNKYRRSVVLVGELLLCLTR